MTVYRKVKRIYNFVRPALPKGYGEFNGVKVKDVGILDMTKSFPDYESELCESIEELIESGMDVTVVGGGRGVSTVRAAQAVGEGGTVTVYEGSEKHVELVKDTVQANGVSSRVKARHAVVARGIGVYTDTDGVNRVKPADLPVTDGLVLDCEGAEIAILAEMNYEPAVVVVETHDRLIPGANVAARHILENREYDVLRERDHANGIRVLSATR